MTQLATPPTPAQSTPPGWYPDTQVPGQQRYWDGAQWTEHRAPMYHVGVPLAPAQQSPNQNWFLRHPVVSALLALIVIGIIAGAADGGSPEETSTGTDSAGTRQAAAPEKESADKAASPEKGTSDKAASEKDEAAAAPAEPAPAEEVSLQDRFLDVIAAGAESADDADNEIQVVQARKERTAQLRELLPANLEVVKWTGEIDDVSTEMGGDKGVLTISLGGDVKVSTWNNSLSDIGSNTLISPHSDLYAVLGELSSGDEVVFSGHFIRDPNSGLEEQSLMDVNGMLTPTFTFKFDSITKQ